MPSTTPLQVTSQGSAPPACMAQLARRDSAELALLACTVVSDPPWPVLSACSRSAASPPRTSPTTMWSGRWRSACRTRSRIDTGASESAAPGLEAQAVRALDPELERVLDGDDPLLLGEQLDQGVQERGLPRAGASGDQDVPPGPERVAGGAEHLLGKGPLADEVFGRERAAPEPGGSSSPRGGSRAECRWRPSSRRRAVRLGRAGSRDRAQAGAQCGSPPGRAPRR